MIPSRIIQLTVPSSDNGQAFVHTERLHLITRALTDSTYQQLDDMPLAKVYRHQNFQKNSPILLISCHIDSVYDDYFASLKDEEMQGTFDNSVCNAILIEAMLNSLLPAQVLVSFTGDEEYNSSGADQTIELLRNKGLFASLEMVIALDITEECYRKAHYTIENYFVAQHKSQSLCTFSTKHNFKNFLQGIMHATTFIKDAEADESWQYDEHNLNCFSLCLPCRLLGTDMHADTGVAILQESLKKYTYALQQLTEGILQTNR